MVATRDVAMVDDRPTLSSSREDTLARKQPDETAVAAATLLLGNLRLLMLFITTVQPHIRPTQSGIVASATASTPFGPAVNLSLLSKTPEEVASDPGLIEQLYRSVAALGEAV